MLRALRNDVVCQNEEENKEKKKMKNERKTLWKRINASN